MFILFFFLPNMTSHHKKKYSYSAATGHAQVIGFQIKSHGTIAQRKDH